MRPAGEAAMRSRPGRRPQEPARRLLHSFKIHLAVYVPVNLMFIGIWAAGGGGYFWPVWSILGWGVAVSCHAARSSPRSGLG